MLGIQICLETETQGRKKDDCFLIFLSVADLEFLNSTVHSSLSFRKKERKKQKFAVFL